MGYPNEQSNPAAAIPVWIAPAPAGAGMLVLNIANDDSVIVAEGSGTFMGISINTAGDASNATVFDGVDGNGVVLGTFSTSVVGSNFPPGGWPFSVGLFVVTESSDPAANITVSYFVG